MLTPVMIVSFLRSTVASMKQKESIKPVVLSLFFQYNVVSALIIDFCICEEKISFYNLKTHTCLKMYFHGFIVFKRSLTEIYR